MKDVIKINSRYINGIFHTSMGIDINPTIEHSRFMLYITKRSNIKQVF